MKETRRGEYNTDEPFDEIVLEKIKPEIARAFILLESTLRWKTIMPIGQETNRSAQVVREKADQMKNEINSFIDAQVMTLMDGIESRAGVHGRNSEEVSKMAEVDIEKTMQLINKKICKECDRNGDSAREIYLLALALKEMNQIRENSAHG